VSLRGAAGAGKRLHPGVVPVGVEPIEKPCQQDCTGAVDSIKLR